MATTEAKPQRFMLLILLSCFACILVLRAFGQFADDPGLGWHLVNGEAIRTSFHIPHVDTLLSIERPWVSDQWLADYFFAVVMHYAGWPGLYIVGFILFFTAWYLAVSSATQQTASVLALFVALYITMNLMSVHAVLRPVLWSFIFFIVQVRGIHAMLKERSVALRTYVGTALLYVCWANMHPSFLLGIVLLGIVLLTEIFDRFLLAADQRAPHVSMTNQLCLLILVALGASLCNPYGISLHESILALGGSKFFMSLNSEWLPLQFRSVEGQLLSVALALLVLRQLYSDVNSEQLFDQHRRRFTMLALSFFLYQTCSSIRFLPYVSLLLYAPLLEAVHSLIQRIETVLLSFAETHARELIVKSLTLLWSISLVVLAGKGMYARALTLGPSATMYPYRIASLLIEQADSLGTPSIVYNHPDLGGFLIYQGQGKIRPVLDDRNGLLNEAPYKEFLALKDPQAIINTARQYHAPFVIVRHRDMEKAQSALPVLIDDGDYQLLKVLPE
jgi:hypothetical protein